MVDLPELDQYEVPLSQMERRAFAIRDEAQELRRSLDASVLRGETGQEALHALRQTVAVLDRVDVLLDDARALWGRARRAKDNLEGETRERVDGSLDREASRRLEFQSAADRMAKANLENIEERRNVRLLGRLVDVTKEVFDTVLGYHFQLNGLREDIRSALNVFRFENSLDR